MFIGVLLEICFLKRSGGWRNFLYSGESPNDSGDIQSYYFGGQLINNFFGFKMASAKIYADRRAARF